MTYKQVKGTGLANTCPIIDKGSENPKDLKGGNYNLTNFCMEPTSIKVKEDEEGEFENTKLLTRLTYTLDSMDGKFNVSGGSVSMTEEEGIDFAPVTVQLAGGERVPFLFTIKELKASGPVDGSIKGSFLVPSYRGSTFLDPKGRGGSTGYDAAVGIIAASDSEEFANVKRTDSGQGEAVFSIAKVDPGTGEIAGVFETVQPSDTDLGAKAPKEVKTTGIWYARLQ